MSESPIRDDMHPDSSRTGPDTTTMPSRSKSLVRKSSRVPVVSVGTCHVQTETTGTHLGSLLDDLKVNGRERGRLDLGHLARCTVMVDLPVDQRAIQRNPVPLLVFQTFKDAKDAPSKMIS